jgi:hypothetical protein
MSERLIISHYETDDGADGVPQSHQSREMGMRLVAVVSLLLFTASMTEDSVRAADSCKECRDFQRACLAAHSKAACKTDYDICMKHCKK